MSSYDFFVLFGTFWYFLVLFSTFCYFFGVFATFSDLSFFFEFLRVFWTFAKNKRRAEARLPPGAVRRGVRACKKKK